MGYERQRYGVAPKAKVEETLREMNAVAAEHGEIIAVDFDEHSFAPAHMKFEVADGERVILYIEDKSYVIMASDLAEQINGMNARYQQMQNGNGKAG